MTTDTSTRSVIVEKEFPHAAAKVWRALTESSLIEQWLMKNDFEPTTGRAFTLRMDPVPNWNGVIDCKVVAIDEGKTLAYSWATMGTETMVTFTLTPTGAGTHVRVEQAGFNPENKAAIGGANYGWQSFLGKLGTVVGELD
jgi:uncharacterized protein YndB with AHSA1/START domain